MWSLFSLYEFSGWRIDGSIVRRIAVAGPAAGWTLNLLPAAALADSATVAFLLWRRRSTRGYLQVSAEASYAAIARFVQFDGVEARRRCADHALRLKLRLVVERVDKRRDFDGP